MQELSRFHTDVLSAYDTSFYAFLLLRFLPLELGTRRDLYATRFLDVREQLGFFGSCHVFLRRSPASTERRRSRDVDLLGRISQLLQQLHHRFWLFATILYALRHALLVELEIMGICLARHAARNRDNHLACCICRSTWRLCPKACRTDTGRGHATCATGRVTLLSFASL